MSAPADDSVAAFTVERAPLLGRIVRLGPRSVDPILRRHEYPAPVALMLGEALAFAALMGSLLKAEGRLIVQAQGDGPVPLLVAEHRSGGALRGYARLAPDARARLGPQRHQPPRALIGEGALAVTLDQGPDFAAHQGLVPLAGESLAACAAAYFRDSEQIDTHIALAVGEVLRADSDPLWRAGGLLIQRIAPDAARGDTEEGWRRSAIFFDTITDGELVDPALPMDRVLYRLFNEDGVRMGVPSPLVDQCACDAERLAAVMRTFSAEEIDGLKEPDGLLRARCQFCSRQYEIDPAALSA